ncbi:hypothetical protein E8E11_000454 [Didymella keratinophila]|nr:hypothetical protein E8E11_000454 [Didymella keratinophila]
MALFALDEQGAYPHPDFNFRITVRSMLLLFLLLSDVSFAAVIPRRFTASFVAFENATHEQRVTERIALELFFHDSEFNWYESHWEDELTQWAKDNNKAFKLARKERPGLSAAHYYAETVLGWQDTLNLPSLDAVKARFPDDHHKARRVHYTLKSLQLGKTESMLLPVILEGAKEKLDWRCGEFADVSAHKKTVGESHTCIKDILKIVQRVLVSTLTYVSQMKNMLGGVDRQAVGILRKCQFVAIKSTTQTVIKINALSVASKTINRLFGGFEGKVITHLARESMNSTMAMLEDAVAEDQADAWDAQWSDPDHPTWGALAVAEHPTNEYRNTSRKNPSIYDSMEVDHQIFFRHYRKANPDSKSSEPAGTDSETEAEQSQDKPSTRVMNLFGIRKFRSQSDDAIRSYHLRDNVYGNVILHLVSEGGSPMDLDTALDFLSRNSHLINKRIQQLQPKEARISSEYMQPLVARHDFPTPQISIMPSARWNVYPGGDEKTGSDVDMYHQILHEVNGDIDTLDALGIPLPSKREVQQRPQDDGNSTFSVNIPERLFEDEMDFPEYHDMCGIGSYTGKNEFEASCHKYVNTSTSTVTRRIKTRHTAAEEDLLLMADHLRKRFPTYRAWVNAKQLDDRSFQAITPITHTPENIHKALVEHNKDIELETFKTLKNGLVSKAYADSACLVSCFPADKTPSYRPTGSVEYMDRAYCTVGCYNPTKKHMEPLRGFNDDGGAWNRERLEREIDWYCGGHTSDNEAASGAWYSPQWKAVYDDLEYCLNSYETLAQEHPAAFLLNMCRAQYAVVIPPGTNSSQEFWNGGHYKENYKACEIYWDFYNKHKDMSDHDLNHEICSLWGLHHAGDKRGVNHDEKNFHYVNDLLQDRGCHNWKSDGKNHCKLTDSSSPSTSDCSDQERGRSGLTKRSGKKGKLQKDWEKQNKLKSKAEKHARRWQK